MVKGEIGKTVVQHVDTLIDVLKPKQVLSGAGNAISVVFASAGRVAVLDPAMLSEQIAHALRLDVDRVAFSSPFTEEHVQVVKNAGLVPL